MSASYDEDYLVEVQNVSKTYIGKGSTVQALLDINFKVVDCTFVSLLGPSGCGKTTLLNIIGGLDVPSEGNVFMRGAPVNSKSRYREAGFVFQDSNLFPWRTVFENVTLPLEVMHINTKENCEKAQELLKIVGLVGFEDSHPDNLSGGMKQRVAISRALIWDPSLLLMDEPFGALDAITRMKMADWLLSVWNERKKTVIFVTHNIQEAVFLSDRVMVMSPRPGRIVADVEINLPRPRDINKVFEGPRFNALMGELHRILHSTQGANQENEK